MSTTATEHVGPEESTQQDELSNRLAIVHRDLIEGWSKPDLVSKLMFAWGISRRTAYNYISQVEETLTNPEESEDTRTSLTRSQIARGRLLVQLNEELRRLQGTDNSHDKLRVMNAIRQVLDARDRTAQALNGLESEALMEKISAAVAKAEAREKAAAQANEVQLDPGTDEVDAPEELFDETADDEESDSDESELPTPEQSLSPTLSPRPASEPRMQAVSTPVQLPQADAPAAADPNLVPVPVRMLELMDQMEAFMRGPGAPRQGVMTPPADSRATELHKISIAPQFQPQAPNPRKSMPEQRIGAKPPAPVQLHK